MPVLFTAHRVRALPARTHFQINLHGVTGQKSRMSELFAAHWKPVLPDAGRDSLHYGAAAVQPAASSSPPDCCIQMVRISYDPCKTPGIHFGYLVFW